MQSKQIVTGLPKFKVDGMHKVCAACQFGKQSKGSFPHDRNVCKRPLEVVHTNVWGPADTAVYMVAGTMSLSLMTIQGKYGSIHA